MKKEIEKKKKYWYRFTHEECVVCGAGGTWKERVYSNKPKNIYKRHIFKQFLCGNHYL